MRTIYIDDNFISHAKYAEGRRAVETTALDDVCDAALPFYRYVPKGSRWVKTNGTFVKGEFVQCIDSRAANLLQQQYEAQLTAAAAAYTEGVNSI